MASDISRRSIIAGAIGAIGTGALGISTYNWFQYSHMYSTRHHIQIRRLWGQNLSEETVTLDITTYDSSGQPYERTYELDSSESGQREENKKAMNGPWVSYEDEYSFQIKLDDEELLLEHEEIVNELPGLCCEDHNANIVVTVTEEKGLKSKISLSE